MSRTTLTSVPLTFGQDVFADSATQYHNLGEKASTSDGREFRYCKVGAVALVPGKLQQGPAQDATNMQNLAVTATAIGATSITTSTTVTLTVNQLAGGLMTVTTSAGVGYTYKIKGNTAATTAVTTLTLEDPIVIALTTGSRLDLMPNPFDGVIVNPAAASSMPVGAAVGIVTAAQFGWIQTKGSANLLADGNIAVGTSVCASAATAGAVKTNVAAGPYVGNAVTDIATTEYGLVYINL